MKTKLLRKVKSKIKIYKRGSLYRVHNTTENYYSSDFKLPETAFAYYRVCVLREAEKIFGYKPKEVLR